MRPENPAYSATICGVLLAAGGSVRFGGDKLLAPLPDGTPVLEAAARSLRVGGVDGVQAVVAPGQQARRRLLEGLGIAVVDAPAAQEGMGHSLAAAVAETAPAGGWVVALGDMPFVQPATVAAVSERLRFGQDLVVPAYGDRYGHPRGFGSAWEPALRECAGDQGPRAAVREELTAGAGILPVDDPGVVRDIDEPADLQPMNRKGD